MRPYTSTTTMFSGIALVHVQGTSSRIVGAPAQWKSQAEAVPLFQLHTEIV